MKSCGNCGAQTEGDSKFCRNCGTRLELPSEEANTWRLAPNTSRDPSPPYPTAPSRPANTAEPPQVTGPAYVPPEYGWMTYDPQPPAVRPSPGVDLGDSLQRGWQIYKEYWVEMSMGSLIGSFLSVCTLGLLAGPTLLGLYRMAFKAMRGERPDVGDIFEWEGRFLPAAVTFFIFVILHFALGGIAKGSIGGILDFVVGPFLTIGLALTMPLLLERRMDLAAAINEVGRLIFSRNTLVWWIVGLVFGVINVGGLLACFFGVFITFPFTVSAAAVAYRDTFGLDDPNRTLP